MAKVFRENKQLGGYETMYPVRKAVRSQEVVDRIRKHTTHTVSKRVYGSTCVLQVSEKFGKGRFTITIEDPQSEITTLLDILEGIETDPNTIYSDILAILK